MSYIGLNENAWRAVSMTQNQLQTTARPATEGLTKESIQLMSRAISKNTRTAYGRAYRKFNEFREDRPVTDPLICEWLQEMDSRGLAPSTIQLMLAGVVWAYRQQGVLVDTTRSSLVMKGIKRGDEAQQRGRGQQRGIRRAEVELLRRKLNTGKLRDLRDRAIVGLMSDGLLRGSELIRLRARDVLHVQPGGTARINLRRSKSDQDGEGAILFVGKPVADDVKAYVREGEIQPGDPLIQGISRGGNLSGRAMTIQGLNVTVKRLANAHLEIAEGVSSHSFRIGTAQSLASRGSGLVELQNAGRWKSADMPARYTRGQAASRGAVARLLYP